MDTALPPQGSATAESPVDKPEPQYLRFKTLRGKVHPPDFMFIDEALDRLAYQLYGDEWRYCPQLKSLPLYWGATKKYSLGYYSFRYEWNGKRWVIEGERIKISKEDRPDLRKARAMFTKTVGRMRDALSRGELSAHRHSISLDPIELSQRGIWTKNIKSIYHIGELCEESTGGEKPKKEQILIGRDKFEPWVLQQSLQPIIPAGAKIEADLPALKKVIEEHVEARKYKLYLEEFETGVAPILRNLNMKAPTETARELFGELDHSVRRWRGNPRGRNSPELMKEDLPNLLKVIGDECVRQRRAASLEPETAA